MSSLSPDDFQALVTLDEERQTEMAARGIEPLSEDAARQCLSELLKQNLAPAEIRNQMGTRFDALCIIEGGKISIIGIDSKVTLDLT